MSVYGGWPCPTDPTHGRLLDFPTESYGYYCPNQKHDGDKDHPRTSPFFTTEAAEEAAGMRRERRGA